MNQMKDRTELKLNYDAPKELICFRLYKEIGVTLVD
jgi:hypothetical protein